MPVLSNLIGAAWPLLHSQSFEVCFRTSQRFILLCNILARLIQAVASQQWVVTSGGLKQAYVLDAILLLVNQDPMKEMLLQLAIVQIVYNVGSMCNASGQHRANDGKMSKHDISAMTESEFFVLVMLVVIPMHRCYPKDRKIIFIRNARSSMTLCIDNRPLL